MGDRRRSSIKVADVMVPQHLITAAKRTSVRYSMMPRYSGQRQPTIGEEPQEDEVPDMPQMPFRHRPMTLDLEAGRLSGREQVGTTAVRPPSAIYPTARQDASFARSSRAITIQEPAKVKFNDAGPFTTEQDLEKYSLQKDSSSTEVEEEEEYAPDDLRHFKRRTIMQSVVPDAVQDTVRNVSQKVRKSSIYEVYKKAKERGVELERKRWLQILFEYSFYTILIAFVYFVLVGMPLWKGTVYYMYLLVATKFAITGGWAVTFGLATVYAFFPLFFLFEDDPPAVDPEAEVDYSKIPGIDKTALLIPCYKSANIIGPTLVAALKVFPAKNIFVLANGNSETPLDNTEEVCRPFGVNHLWCPVGSKIIAQFLGCYAAKDFEHVLLIDDDCAIPPNFPIVSERIVGKIKCIGYTIKSVGPNSSKGTWCTQAQDLEYKLSGLQRAGAGKIGSAIFPHGAISLWDRAFLIETFYDHPGFSVSEDWFFGHSCRRLGGRILMCSSVFVETETPDSIFFSNGAARGGFGEMTVFKQRFLRWNFFFVNGIFYDLGYIFFSWQLGWWEIGTKFIVFQEVYETLLYLLTPFMLPICFIVNPAFSGYMLLATLGMYFVNTAIFNEIHLRRKDERVNWSMLIAYYIPYKFALTFVNVVSCYWSLYKYATYFAKPHLKVTEDEKAVGVVLQLEEEVLDTKPGDFDEKKAAKRGRSMMINVVGSRVSMGVNRGGRMSMMKGQRVSVLNQGQLVFLPPQGEPVGDPDMNSVAGAARRLAPMEHETTPVEEEEEEDEQSAQPEVHPGGHPPFGMSSGSEDKEEVDSSTSRRKASWAQSQV